MNFQLLDCTLRDGGYLNNWEFKEQDTISIISKLNSAKIEKIECGYLSKKGKKYNTTKFIDLSYFNELISPLAEKLTSSLFLMIDYNDFETKSLLDKNAKANFVTGLRLAFHKTDLDKIELEIENILNKGYELYLQPMLTNNYSKEEFIKLLQLTNKYQVNSLYLVDSFGNITFEEIKFFYNLINEYLNPNITIGFHSHNNMQTAYSNSVNLLNYTQRDIIFDASLCGLGRGAGNLNTEVFSSYLNKNKNKAYLLNNLLEVIDDNVIKYLKNSDTRNNIIYFLAALEQIHPNYPTLLLEKNLKLTEIKAIFDTLENKAKFDMELVKSL